METKTDSLWERQTDEDKDRDSLRERHIQMETNGDTDRQTQSVEKTDRWRHRQTV